MSDTAVWSAVSGPVLTILPPVFLPENYPEEGMEMTAKDYRKLAEVLRGEWLMCEGMPGENTIRRCVWRTALSVADVAAQDNERFDRERFYRAVFGSDQWAAQQSIDYDKV